MKRVDANSDNLDTRKRLILFHNTRCKPSNALLMPSDDINYDTMLLNQVKAVNIVAADLKASWLKLRGFDEPSKLRQLGFDALHLVNPSWCNDALLTYGRDDLLSIFLVTPEDSVALAGSPAVQLLNISTTELLKPCIGFPVEACAVMQQLPRGRSLAGVNADLLLDCGMRLSTLSKCGYTVENIIRDTTASSTHLQKLGFQF